MTLRVSVVTPTLSRPQEVVDLLSNLAAQEPLPSEVILVDGAGPEDDRTRDAVAKAEPGLPFPCHYIRHGGGTAIQRNIGIDRATGKLIALLDDDVRLEAGYFKAMVEVFLEDSVNRVGGVVGYRKNQYFAPESVGRWKWYRRLKLLKVFEPGRYDFDCGYPINANMQPPFSGVRPVDFMTTACAVWRREVVDSGLRFDPFFVGYGILEDAHFALRAGRDWQLLQCGDALCQELSSPRGRENHRLIGYKCAVNYYYVFRDIAGPLSWVQRFRFWKFQAFDIFRISTSALRRRRWSDVAHLHGRLEGIWSIATGTAFPRKTPPGKAPKPASREAP